MAVDEIIANGVTEILKKLVSVVANEITLVWDFKDELKKLQTTLNMILAVMEDAENKQVSSKSVRLWMEELKAIAYDAEDILDDYYYEVILCKHKKKKVHNVLFSNSKPSFVVSWKLAPKVKKINEKFNNIAKRKNDLNLQTIDVGSSSSSHTMMMMMKNRETYSLVPADLKIVGRENDKSKIINTLLDKDSCLVLSIVGLGGMGKTTMAQLVYNDEAIKNHFQLNIWICVSDPFDVKKLLKNIVNSIGTGKKYDDAATMDDIVLGLQDALREKKFLLVLDDVWNDEPDDWYKFKTPLMVGAKGSKILVTTRSVKVAELMVDKFPPYPLGILNDNDSWSLFKELAFGSATGAVESPKLVEIGEEMVKRCGGLPLAVIFLGSLMRSRKKEEEWKNIRDTEIWHESREGKKSRNRILPSLRLSYECLPSHLKQCFSYCCLFPKDWEIDRKTLIRLWMAEGFLIESPGENTMEEIGNEYFQSLVSNSFFQNINIDEAGDIVTCKMHDLVHDLALSVVGKNECLIVESAHDIELISEVTRRLNLVNLDKDMVANVLEALKKAKKLRTIFFKHQIIHFDIENVFKENKGLRVLDLSGSVVTSESTSSSIGGLKHLRYLYLPEALTIPKGIGRLCFLQTLNKFKLGVKKKKKKKNASGIEELGGLNLLTGDLNIQCLKNVTNETDACRANLKEKQKLSGLNLSWYGGYQYHSHAINNDEAVLKRLRPHPNLRTLCIDGFEGAKLPMWIEDSSCLPNLVHLNLSGGSYEQVAGFGALPSLRSLILYNVDKLKCIGNELYYSAGSGSSSSSTRTTIAFPSLKKLTLNSLSSFKEWVVPIPPLSTSTTGATTSCFPLLEELNIWYCPLLSTITPTTTSIIFPSLKVLNLEQIDGRAAETLVTNNLYSLTSLTLDGIPNLISLPRQGLMENNNTLLTLEISYCPEFNGFLPPNKDELQVSCSSLQCLRLFRCPVLRHFPDIRSLNSLRRLSIWYCTELKSLPSAPPENVLTCLSSSLEQLQTVDIRETGDIKEYIQWKKESS